jgi:WD40 repeat protein
MVGPVGTDNTFGSGGLFFTPDDRYLFTNIDATGRLWDVDSGQQIGTSIKTAQGTLTGANHDHTGVRFVTAAPDATLVWNLDTDTWPEIPCRAAGVDLTEAEWEQWGPRGEAHRRICP